MSLILLGILNSQVSGGGAGAYDLLETQVLTSSASSVTFTGLGSYSDYKHLQVRMVARNGATAGADKWVYLTLNGDTGSNYASHRLQGNGSSVFSNAYTSRANMVAALITSSASGTQGFGSALIHLLDFGNSSKNTTIRSLNGMADSANLIALYSGFWNNTNAVTSLTLAPEDNSFITGSRFSLYGIRGA